MNEDRWAFLAVQAYKRKLLTFDEEERQDVYWRLRERLIFDSIDQDRELELRKLLYFGHMLVAQSNEVYEQAVQQYDLFYRLLLPYDQETQGQRQSLIDRMIADYKRLIGMPERVEETNDG